MVLHHLASRANGVSIAGFGKRVKPELAALPRLGQPLPQLAQRQRLHLVLGGGSRDDNDDFGSGAGIDRGYAHLHADLPVFEKDLGWCGVPCQIRRLRR